MDNFAVSLVRSTVEYFSGSSGESKRPTRGAPRAIDLAIQPNGSTLNIRLGGFSAAIALGLAAYGSYVTTNATDNRKRSLENANKHHLTQSIGLLLSHKAHYPWVSASLFLAGILLFSAPLYAYGIWNYDKLVQLVPFGNLLHISAWLSFLL